MGLQSNMARSNKWVALNNKQLRAFADPVQDPVGIQNAVAQLLGRVSTIENTPVPTAAYVNTLTQRVLTLEQIPSLQPSISAVSFRVGTLEASPSLQPAINAAVGRIAALEAVPAPVIPKLSAAVPPQVNVVGSAGVSADVAAADHTHAARVQRKVVVLAADGTASWTFTKAFQQKPSLQYMVFQASGQPVVVDATTWIMLNGLYNGVIVRGKRSRPTPTMAPSVPAQLTLVSLLTATITALNTLSSAVSSIVTSLSNFDIFGGGNLEGVEVHLSAGDQM